MKKSLLSNQEIIVAIACGNSAAFKILFDQYYPVLVKVLLRYSSDESQINALIQGIYLRLWESRSSLVNLSAGDFKAYFIVTARNYAITEISKKAKLSNNSLAASHKYFDADSTVKDASESLALMENYARAVERDLANSSESDILRQELGHIYAKICTAFVLLAKTMETGISNAISLLRQELVLFRR